MSWEDVPWDMQIDKNDSINGNLTNFIYGWATNRARRKQREAQEERRLKDIKAVENFVRIWFQQERGYTFIDFRQVLKVKNGWNVTVNIDKESLKLKISDFGDILGYQKLKK